MSSQVEVDRRNPDGFHLASFFLSLPYLTLSLTAPTQMSGSSDPSLDKDQLKSSLRLSDCHHANTLTTLLSLLFEPTDALHTLLVPSVLLRLTARGSPPDSYDQLIEICKDVAEGGWTLEQKAEFISGHPMIGEVKLSGLSGAEQGQGRQDVTSRIVLERWV